MNRTRGACPRTSVATGVVGLLLAAWAAVAAPAPTPTLVAHPHDRYAIPLPEAGTWSIQHQSWNDPLPYKIQDTLTLRHPEGAVFFIDCWNNPDELDTAAWMAAYPDVLTFPAADATPATAGAEGLDAVRHAWTDIPQAFDSETVLFARSNLVVRLHYLKRDRGLMGAAFEALVDGIEFTRRASWTPAREAGLSSTFEPAPGLLVYTCGGDNDTCQCGADNPFPCCLSDNSCNGGGTAGNCTWYAWHSGCCNWGVNVPARGHAKTWADSCNGVSGYTVSTTPGANCIAVRTSGTYGHVAWVTGVDANNIYVRDQSCCGPPWGTKNTTWARSYFDKFIYHGGGPPDPCSGTDNASYVSEGAPYDNDVLQPNQTFTKRWTMRNSGSSTWKNSCNHKWAFDGGERFGAAEFTDVGSDVVPGANKDWNISMRAPSSPGTYTGYWRTDRYGTGRFGDRVWLTIRVENPTGSLKVDINPSDARSAGAHWRRTGTSTWRDGGYTESGLSPGGYTVEFNDIANWDKPANVGVTVNAGQTTTISRDYSRHTGSIQATIEPSGARSAGAQWRVSGGSWLNSGALITGQPTGNYTIEFSGLSGWDTPSSRQVTVSKGQTATTTGTYIQHLGSLQVTLSPSAAVTAGAQWRIAGGSWRNSGTLVTGLAIGSYTVEYNTLSGWTGPGSESLTVNRDQTTSVTRRYNRAPALSVPGAQFVHVGSPLTFQVTGSDPDGDAVTLTCPNPPSGATFQQTGLTGTFAFTPSAGQAGLASTLRFRATDALNAYVEQTVALTVGTPPTVGDVPDYRPLVGQAVQVNVSVSEPNGDAVNLSASGLPSGATFDAAPDGRSGVFNYTPKQSHGGQVYDILFTATDADGSDAEAMRIVVGVPPAIRPLTNATVIVGRTIEFPVAADEPNGDAIAIQMSGAPTNALLLGTGASRTFRLTPTPDQAGQTHTLVFTATDTDGTDTESITLQIKGPPVFNAVTNARVVTGTTLDRTVSAVDPDGDPMQFQVEGAPASTLIATNPSGVRLVYTPTVPEGGLVFTTRVYAADADGVSTAALRITVGGLPDIRPVADRLVFVGDTLAFDVIADEPNGDTVTFSVTGQPANATFSALGLVGSFAFTPQPDQLGQSFDMVFRAEDQDGFDTEAVRCVVAGPPVLDPIPHARVVVNTCTSLAVRAIDPNEDPITLFAHDRPAHAAFSSTGGIGHLAFCPTPAQGAQCYTVRVEAVASDGADERLVELLVGVPNVFAPIPDATVAEYNTLRFELSATDANGDPIALTASNLPAHASLTISNLDGTGTFVFSPSSYQGGTAYPIVFHSADIDGRQAQTVTVTVLNDDIHESNDTLAEAANAQALAGQWVSLWQSDDDWFAFDCALGYQRLTVEAQYAPTEGDLRIRLTDASGVILAEAEGAGQGAVAMDFTTPYLGRHYLQVTGPNAGTGYSLRWNAAASWAACPAPPDPYEPNDTDPEAAALPQGLPLAQGSGVGLLEGPDRFALDVPPAREDLTIAWLTPEGVPGISAELIDPTGHSLASFTGTGAVTQRVRAIREGRHILRLSPVGNPSCFPYDLQWSAQSGVTGAPVVYLTGRHLSLPIDASAQPGRFIDPAGPEGLRFNAAGTGGGLGVDLWGNGLMVCDWVMGVTGSIRETGGAWHRPPVVEKHSTGTLNRALLHGEPVAGLLAGRTIAFDDRDCVIRFEDTLTASAGLTNVVWLDSIDPNLDFAEHYAINTRNDVIGGIATGDLACAYGPLSGRAMLLGVLGADAKTDCSFVSMKNPYSVWNNPGDPNGAVGNLALKRVWKPGDLAAGQTRTSQWALAFGATSNEARAAYDRYLLAAHLADDLFEANDAREHATPLDTAQCTAGILAKQGNEDWYRIDVAPGRQHLSVTCLYATAEATLDVVLFDERGWTVSQARAYADEGLAVEAWLPGFGVAYVRVSGDNRGAIYDLTIRDHATWPGCPAGPTAGTADRAAAATWTEDAWLSWIAPPVAMAASSTWHRIPAMPGGECLTVDARFDAQQGALSLTLEDADGVVVGVSTATPAGASLRATVPHEGDCFLAVRSPAGATCQPYDLLWRGAEDSQAAGLLLDGDFVRLPIDRTAQPGRMLLPGDPGGARFRAAGDGGHRGVDLWSHGFFLCDSAIGIDGGTLRTNGLGWFEAPAVAETGAGAWNRASLSGRPVDGLRYTRTFRFHDRDRAVLIEDALAPEGSPAWTNIMLFDCIDANPDFAASGLLDSSNRTYGLFASNDTVLAAGRSAPVCAAITRLDSASRVDASFLSLRNPYYIWNAPRHPQGEVNNLALKRLASIDRATTPATSRWLIAFGETPEAALREAARVGAGTLGRPTLDADADGLPDWWEALHLAANADGSGDEDGDGLSNREEYLSGSGPLTAAGLPALEASMPSASPTGSPVVLRWNGTWGMEYGLMRSTNLLSPFEWVATNLTALPSLNSYTDRTEWTGPGVYYRLRIKPAPPATPDIEP